jgi:broad specificity phosphatase PhoE
MSKKTIVSLVTALLLLPAAANAQKLLFIVRHAERADADSATKMMNSDPPLSETGKARAETIAEMLADSGVASIYTTEFRRTQETAAPLAAKIQVAPVQISSRDTEALIKTLRTRDGGKIVLVVGHSNTVPDIIQAYGGPRVTIDDKEYDNLFIVVPADGTTTRIRFRPK